MNSFADLQPARVQRALRAAPWAAMSALSLSLAAGLAGAQSVAVPASATNPVIYPAKDQSPRQQDKDKYECYDWARNQSGFDPAQAQQAPPQAPQTAPTSATQSTAAGGVSTSGMAKGAMGGAAIAELGAHDAGKGAAAGVVGAALFEKVKQRQAQIAKEQQMGQQQAMQVSQMSQQQAARGQQRATYGKAFSACLEARGYVVK